MEASVKDFCFDLSLNSSGVGALVESGIKCVANIVRSSSFFTPLMNFEATASFVLLFDSSGWLRLLSVSKLSRNLTIVSSSRFLCFSKRIIAWCRCTPEPKRFNKMSTIFSAVSRWYCFLTITQFRAVPSKLLVSALHSCLSDKSSSSECSFITSIQVSIQPSDLIYSILVS